MIFCRECWYSRHGSPRYIELADKPSVVLASGTSHAATVPFATNEKTNHGLGLVYSLLLRHGEVHNERPAKTAIFGIVSKKAIVLYPQRAFLYFKFFQYYYCNYVVIGSRLLIT